LICSTSPDIVSLPVELVANTDAMLIAPILSVVSAAAPKTIAESAPGKFVFHEAKSAATAKLAVAPRNKPAIAKGAIFLSNLIFLTSFQWILSINQLFRAAFATIFRLLDFYIMAINLDEERYSETFTGQTATFRLLNKLY
jgi:hypothetical protein